MGEQRQRDERGRFLKNNTTGNRFKEGEDAKTAGRNGGLTFAKNNQRRKLLKEVLRDELDSEIQLKNGRTVSKMEAVVSAVVKNLYDKPNAKGLKIMAELLGEMEINVNLNQAEKPRIVFDDGEDEQ